MEIATMNVPRIDGQVRVLLDVSGSMHGALTGYRKGATSMVRCLDVAALIAASILRKNAWAMGTSPSTIVSCRARCRERMESWRWLPCSPHCLRAEPTARHRCVTSTIWKNLWTW